MGSNFQETQSQPHGRLVSAEGEPRPTGSVLGGPSVMEAQSGSQSPGRSAGIPSATGGRRPAVPHLRRSAAAPPSRPPPPCPACPARTTPRPLYSPARGRGIAGAARATVPARLRLRSRPARRRVRPQRGLARPLPALRAPPAAPSAPYRPSQRSSPASGRLRAAPPGGARLGGPSRAGGVAVWSALCARREGRAVWAWAQQPVPSPRAGEDGRIRNLRFFRNKPQRHPSFPHLTHPSSQQ